MRTRRQLSGETESTDINISPLIDMVFILLIFFIVTTVFVEEKGLRVEKPNPASTNTEDNETILFTLTASGQVVFNGKDVGTGGVAATVRQMTQRKQIPVIIKVNKGAIANLMVRVIDESRIAGAKNLSLTSGE